MEIRIATRKSALALWQAEHVAGLLSQLDGVSGVELVPLSTRGDEVLDRSLQKIGGKGLFIKELEVAMQEGRADIAVHSMKDVPAEMPDGFCIASVLKRANFADALVAGPGAKLGGLPRNARIGSSSLWRQVQLTLLREDLVVEPLRGNVNTRLAKLDSGEFDAIILAAAGLERLGMQDRISYEFTPVEMLPAAAQGVVGIECLAGHSDLIHLLSKLEDADAKVTTSAERAIAQRLQANCQSPVASFAELSGEQVTLTAFVASADGSQHIRESISGDSSDAEAIGLRLADQLIADGALDLLTDENDA